jgi:hypothetical protein
MNSLPAPDGDTWCTKLHHWVFYSECCDGTCNHRCEAKSPKEIYDGAYGDGWYEKHKRGS